MANKQIKMVDPIRHPKIQLPIESDMKARYKTMTQAMTKMLTVALTHSMLK